MNTTEKFDVNHFAEYKSKVIIEHNICEENEEKIKCIDSGTVIMHVFGLESMYSSCSFN